MPTKQTIKLNIGSGTTYIPDFINIDISKRADISLNLNKNRLPFKTNSVDLIFSYHTLEHLSKYLFALKEIHRVLKHGGHFLLGVPYITLTKYNLVNPYHKQNFNEYSFDFFDKDKLLGSAAEDGNIKFKKIFHRIHYIGITNYMPEVFRTILRKHFLNTADKIDFGLIAVKEDNNKIKINNKLISKMLNEFNKCLQSRVSYF